LTFLPQENNNDGKYVGKNMLYLTKAVITGDVDEVRVQSEEPNLKSLPGKP
jgi:hypothetical protein